MHNSEPMVRNRRTWQVNPADSDRLGLVPGEPARVQSAPGAEQVETEATDEMPMDPLWARRCSTASL